MLEKEFIPYEESSELKELGFKESCLAAYFVFGYYGQTKPELFINGIGKQLEDRIEELEKHAYFDLSVPTFSQAFRWFRENYNLHSNISSWRSDDSLSFYHEFEIYSLTSSYSAGDEYPTYEEAELACLRKLIEIVKEKHNVGDLH